MISWIESRLPLRLRTAETHFVRLVVAVDRSPHDMRPDPEEAKAFLAQRATDAVAAANHPPSAASSSSVRGPFPARRLYADSAHCIFAFLPAIDFVHVATCCKSWRRFAETMPAAGYTLAIDGQSACAKLKLLSKSSLKHHVQSVWQAGLEALDAPSPMMFDALRLLHLFPTLTRLSVSIASERDELENEDEQLEAGSPLLLPSSLRTAHLVMSTVGFDYVDWRPEIFVHAVGALARSARGIQQLRLGIPGVELQTRVDFEPLRSLVALEHLVFDFAVSVAQFEVLQSLASLRTLHLNAFRWSVEGSLEFSLAELDPRRHRWSKLEWLHAPNVMLPSQGAAMDALLSLPALTRLPHEVTQWSFLARLADSPHLKVLEIGDLSLLDTGRYGRADRVQEPELDSVAGLVQGVTAQSMVLEQLEHLRIRYLYTPHPAGALWSPLCARLKSLRILHLTNFALPDLDCLASLRGLEQLGLTFCTASLGAADVSKLQRMKKLRRLHISETKDRWLSDAVVTSLLRLELMPALLCFHYHTKDAFTAERIPEIDVQWPPGDCTRDSWSEQRDCDCQLER